MPVDPNHSRHYRGQAGTLGTPTVWVCPACGVQNEGRRVELGCGMCGAGDPLKSKAGKPLETDSTGRVRQVQHPGAAQEDDRYHVGHPTVGGAYSQTAEIGGGKPQTTEARTSTRVLRLVEYLIKPGAEVGTTLRNSLIGTLDLGWGTLTATIVDSCDARQEDLLGLARRQPGVWLANPQHMASQDKTAAWMVKPLTDRREQQIGTGLPEYRPGQRRKDTEVDDTNAPPIPDTGPAYTALQALWAQAIYQACGDRCTHTLSLALSAIAQELQGNSEPEKFLSDQECLQVANALLQQIPKDWNPQPEQDDLTGHEMTEGS